MGRRLRGGLLLMQILLKLYASLGDHLPADHDHGDLLQVAPKKQVVGFDVDLADLHPVQPAHDLPE